MSPSRLLPLQQLSTTTPAFYYVASLADPIHHCGLSVHYARQHSLRYANSPKTALSASPSRCAHAATTAIITDTYACTSIDAHGNADMCGHHSWAILRLYDACGGTWRVASCSAFAIGRHPGARHPEASPKPLATIPFYGGQNICGEISRAPEQEVYQLIGSQPRATQCAGEERGQRDYY